jgi:predicted transcriptional regulator of viral defense system
MRTSNIDDIAREKKIFTKREAEALLGIKKSSVMKTLSRLEQSGWIERLERGKYMVIPLGEKKGNYTMNEFVLASILSPTGSIAYWSALNHHGFTEQIPNTVFVQSTRRRKNPYPELFGVRYWLVTIKEDRFFGNEEIWIGEDPVRITGPEKTLVDCLDSPQYCSGIVEVAKGIRTKDYDLNILKDHAIRFGSWAVLRRLGYLCDLYGIDIDLPPVKQRNYILLDPTMDQGGPINSRWRIKINVDLGELE